MSSIDWDARHALRESILSQIDKRVDEYVKPKYPLQTIDILRWHSQGRDIKISFFPILEYNLIDMISDPMIFIRSYTEPPPNGRKYRVPLADPDCIEESIHCIDELIATYLQSLAEEINAQSGSRGYRSTTK